MPLPKLKPVGKVTARPSAKPPTARASYRVEALRVELRSGPADVIVVYQARQDPARNGLHLSYDAARALRASLEDAARAAGGSVDVLNHRFGLSNLWERFSDADAVVLADWLAGAAGPP